MIRRGMLALIFGVVASVPTAKAADSSNGCGPGWYVFKDTSLVSSSLRTITNAALFPSATVGMTFGTSNCAKHKIVEERDRESVKFATLAYHDLMIQTAQGHGEYLAAFASTLGCNWQAQPEFNRTMQGVYPAIFTSDETLPEDVVAQFRAQIKHHPGLAQACALGMG
ncbi:MAG: DUF3015 family protein [Proteobacteria bacterium]|nr:DUF3015 family protein [Pseudomonadota bacterium]